MRASTLIFLALGLALTGCDKDSDHDGVPKSEDCNDESPLISPDVAEVCDGVDNDCDGEIDELGAIGEVEYWADTDGDGFGDPNESIMSCEEVEGYVSDATDCDPTSGSSYPGGTEVCDGADNDCNGIVDDEATDAPTWYGDADLDGYGGSTFTVEACQAPAGFVASSDDCDDLDAMSYPGADEYCDGADNDCDGTVDEGDALDATTWYRDADADGYGADGDAMPACEQPSGYVLEAGDCDDAYAAIYPEAEEICDELDNDCDGNADYGLAVPGDYETIQEAIDAAVDGELVCVAADEYEEDLYFGGTSVMVVGIDGSGDTSLTGTGDGPVVTMTDGEGPEAGLSGFTISGGMSDQGAGIYLDNASPTLDDLVFTDLYCYGSDSYCEGVGIYSEGGDVVATDLVFTGLDPEPNHGVYGAAAYVDGGSFELDGFTIEDNEISDSTYYFYGFFSADGGDVSLSNGEVTDNTLEPYRSVYGMLVSLGYYTSGDFEISHVDIYDNVIDPTYSSTYMYGLLSFSEGGGGQVVADHVNISANRVNVRGLYGLVMGGWGGDWELTNFIVAGNKATLSSDGYCYGMFMADSRVDGKLTNGDIVYNDLGTTRYMYSGVIIGGYESDIDITNVNVVGNEASGTSYGYGSVYYSGYDEDESYAPDFNWEYSNHYDNGSASYDFSCDNSDCEPDDTYNEDPSYTSVSSSNPMSWGLTLNTRSDMIDAGDPSILDADGTTSDVGAYGGPGGDDW